MTKEVKVSAVCIVPSLDVETRMQVHRGTLKSACYKNLRIYLKVIFHLFSRISPYCSLISSSMSNNWDTGKP